MPHFFIDSRNRVNNIITINDSENYRHIAKALRARVGEKLLLIDEAQIQYETKICKIVSSEIVCEIIDSYPSKRDLDFDLYLAQSPLRSDAQNLVVEKATELGIHTLHPIYTDNCALAKDVINKKTEKWQKIMVESSKQCERAVIPTCAPLTTLDNINIGEYDKILAFCERHTEFPLKNYLQVNPIKKGEKILIIIGPEGGFSEKEFKLFEEKHFTKVSLGDLILRAETAVIVGLGNLIYES